MNKTVEKNKDIKRIKKLYWSCQKHLEKEIESKNELKDLLNSVQKELEQKSKFLRILIKDKKSKKNDLKVEEGIKLKQKSKERQIKGTGRLEKQIEVLSE